MHDLDSKIASLIAAKLNVSEDKVIPAANLERDLGADSLALVELLLLLEDEFQVEIPDEEAGEMTTVQQVVNAISIYVERTRERRDR